MDAHNTTTDTYGKPNNQMTNERTYGSSEQATPYIEDKAAEFNREAGETTGNLLDKVTGKGGFLSSPLAKAAAVGILAFVASKVNSRRK